MFSFTSYTLYAKLQTEYMTNTSRSVGPRCKHHKTARVNSRTASRCIPTTRKCCILLYQPTICGHTHTKGKLKWKSNGSVIGHSVFCNFHSNTFF